MKAPVNPQRVILAVLLLGLWTLPARAQTPLVVYDDQLENGFANWSWGTVDFAETAYVHSGAYGISFVPANWDGLYFELNTGIDTVSYSALDFWINGGSAGGQNLSVALVSGGTAIGSAPLDSFVPGGTIPANSWVEVNIPFASLGVTSGIFDGFWFQENLGVSQPAVYFDDVILDPNMTPPPPPSPVTVAIDPATNRHPVSPLIYGVSWGDPAQLARMHWPVWRWGGNATTRYSWQTDVNNTAFDWYFENIPANTPDPSRLPDNSTADIFIDQALAAGSAPVMTLPTIGWTPIDRTMRWGFSVAKYGAQQSTDPWQPDAGNGVLTNGSPVTGNDPTDTSMPIDASWDAAWMAHIEGRVGPASQGGAKFFELDNEPMLWNSTHRDVHPAPTTYDEMWSKAQAYGGAVKAQDPGALVLGPVEWGWCAYFWSALDGCNDGGPDLQSHGGVHFIEWYLQQMHDYEVSTGTRLLDYLDIHYYPQAQNVALSSDESPATAALRLRTVKSLYDPAYVDESWIGASGYDGGIVRLIPRMKDWIAQRYPGTKLAITEYNWGSDDGPSSALANAEVLAIFGREGVDLAARWVAPDANTRTEDSFKLYLNYDGYGSAVAGDSVQAISSDVDAVGGYAVLSSGNLLRTLLFNKDTSPRDTTVTLPAGFNQTAQLFGFDAANRLGPEGSLAPSGGNLVLTLSPRSATLVAAQLDFNDVPRPNPFYSFVMKLAVDGITSGCGGGNFCPGNPISRSQMAVFLLRAKNGPHFAPPPAQGIFTDVPATNPFAPWIEEAYNEAITGGCGSNPLIYCPGASVLRSTMAVFLLAAEHGAGYAPPACAPPGVFTDVPCPGGGFTNWIYQLVAEGITGGCTATTYCPSQPVTRAQMSVFLVVTFGLP
jgi:hypothetical protein